MFEDSTFESAGTIRTLSRKWMLATFAFNGSILVVLILIPLIYPQALPRFTDIFLMAAPPAPIEQAKSLPIIPRTSSAQPQFTGIFQLPSQIPRSTPKTDEPEAAIAINDDWGSSSSSSSGSPDNPWNSQRPVVVMQQPPKAPAHVSQGVMNGLLYQKVLPAYPPLALTTHTEGTVTLQATISTSGTIENLRVVSGPVMLQQAAVNAVQQWRYRPYQLNGQPVEVETTINVVFKLDP